MDNTGCLLSPLLPAGGGAVEAALNVYLENFATTLGSREQLAIAEFADALLVSLDGSCLADCSIHAEMSTMEAITHSATLNLVVQIIPKTLAVNAAKDATELVAKLRAFHYSAQTNPEKKALAQVQYVLCAGTIASFVDSAARPFPGLHVTAPFSSLALLLQSGLDLVGGTIRDNIAAGVVEPALSKLKIIQFATEAAITILRIDDLIRLEPEPQEGEE